MTTRLNPTPGAVRFIDVGTNMAPGLAQIERLRASHINALKKALLSDPESVVLQEELKKATSPIDWTAQRQQLVDRLDRIEAQLATASGTTAEELLATREQLSRTLRELDRWIITTT